MAYDHCKEDDDFCGHLLHPLLNHFSVFSLQPLVAKPDQLIKRRGKLGLVLVNKNIKQVQQWIEERLNKDIEV